jgi:hypothetical protein
MQAMNQISRALFAVTALALMLPALSQAQPDRDTQEINNYVLTDAGLARYTKAAQALGSMAKSMPSDCDDSDDGDGDGNSKSLDQAAASFSAVPGVKAAIQSAGMTPREFSVFTWSMFQTGTADWMLAQPGGKLSPGTSMANVNFYRKNEAAFKKLGEITGSDDCGDEEEEEEEEEPEGAG